MTPYYDHAGIQIYHGDCLDIMPSLGPVDLVLTDPPYGMDYDVDSGRFTGGNSCGGGRSYHPGGKAPGRFKGRVINDDKPFDPAPFLDYPAVIMWGFHHFASRLPVGTTLVWIKRYDDAFGSFLSDADIAWMKGGHGVYCKRDLTLQGESRFRSHPTQKPVGIMAWCIEKSNATGLILDPFMGSGTTLVAAKELGRRCIGIEIEEKYCEIAAKRLSQEVMDFGIAK